MFELSRKISLAPTTEATAAGSLASRATRRDAGNAQAIRQRKMRLLSPK